MTSSPLLIKPHHHQSFNPSSSSSSSSSSSAAAAAAINPSLWRRPTSPKNLTATLRNGGLLLSWQSPPPLFFRRLKSESEAKAKLKPKSKATNDSVSEDLSALSAASENTTLGGEKPAGVTDSQHHRHHHHRHQHNRHQQHIVQSQRQQLSPNVALNATNKSEVGG